MRRPLLILSLVFLAALFSGCTDGRRFSPEAWRQEDQFQRHAFTGDLLGRRLLIGKGWREVHQMLGPGRTFGRDVSTWNVGLDKETGTPIVLEVDFRDGIATHATVHRE
ncbi:hypothetical protein [Noviluteimonas gilva]|uniref:Lipoprotein n=1 Tax=Noviluteimonas gilva TaxID=2682097 RepID=A0A7C9M196_9GAMM|nr:hypothetical protein [Lysobacter gilvus]MUV14188.1 hypothetical protein [Lysobacter gilvus]